MTNQLTTPRELEAAQDELDQYLHRLTQGLTLLHDVQMVTSNLNPDCIPAYGEEPTPDQVRTYFLALIGESYELMNELNWKPWKREKVIDLEKVADEFADVLAFLGIILVYLNRLGLEPEELADAYHKKTSTNIRRFLGKVPGYGVANHKAAPE